MAKKRRSHINNKNDAIRMGRAISQLRKEYHALKDKEIDRVEKELAELNVSCIFSAFTAYLAQKFNQSPEEIMDALNYIDKEIEKLGDGTYTTASELKLRCALISGVAVLLNDHEQQILDDINEDRYKYVILQNDNNIWQIEKCIIIGTDEAINGKICIVFNDENLITRSLVLSENYGIYDNINDAQEAYETYYEPNF